MASPFVFSKDIATATTIPADWYTDPALLEVEKEQIFCKTWQLVGRLEQLQRPGDFFTCSVVDEPLVITRDTAGKIFAFSFYRFLYPSNPQHHLSTPNTNHLPCPPSFPIPTRPVWPAPTPTKG